MTLFYIPIPTQYLNLTLPYLLLILGIYLGKSSN